MNTAIAFDTHKFVKRMIATGFSEAQAEEQVSLLAEILNNQLSTKADVARVDANVLEIKRDIALIESNLKRDIKELDVKAETHFRELDVKAETRFRELDVKAETRFRELDTKAETRCKELDNKIETVKLTLQKEIESSKVDTLKWTAGMFAAQTAMLIGAMFAVMKMNQPPPHLNPLPLQEMRLPEPLRAPTSVGPAMGLQQAPPHPVP